MSKNVFAAAAALSMMMAGSSAMAGSPASASTPFTVSIVVSDGCIINTSGAVPLHSGTGAPGTALSNLSNTGRVTATCTDGTKYGLTLTSTNNISANDGKFFLKGTGTNATKIEYTVNYTSFTKGDGANADSALTANTPVLSKTSTGTTTSFTGGGAESTITFTFATGTVTGAPKADTYSDIVNVTAEF